MHTADLIDLVTDAGGFATRRQLRRAGANDRDLTRAVRSGDLHRPRLGWYSNLPVDDDRVTAVRVGGRLTGSSALFHLGGWMWARPRTVCVSVPPHAARLRQCRRARVVWDPVAVRERGSVAVVSVVDALVSPAGDGMGLLLPLLLLGVLIAGGAFALRSRIGRTPHDAAS